MASYKLTTWSQHLKTLNIPPEHRSMAKMVRDNYANRIKALERSIKTCNQAKKDYDVYMSQFLPKSLESTLFDGSSSDDDDVIPPKH